MAAATEEESNGDANPKEPSANATNTGTEDTNKTTNNNNNVEVSESNEVNEENATNKDKDEQDKEPQFIFMNGMNILSRDWKKLYKGKEIEYDSDGSGQKGGDPGSHIHKGKMININPGAAGSHKIIIKDENGAYDNFGLSDIKIKLEDDGSKIITFQETKASHSLSVGGGGYRPRQPRYKYMNGETLLFKEWKIGQEIEYDSDVDGNKGGPDGSHQYKGAIEELALETNTIMIKKENGEFQQYKLNQIKIKFEDNMDEFMSEDAFKSLDRVTQQEQRGQHNGTQPRGGGMRRGDGGGRGGRERGPQSQTRHGHMNDKDMMRHKMNGKKGPATGFRGNDDYSDENDGFDLEEEEVNGGGGGPRPGDDLKWDEEQEKWVKIKPTKKDDKKSTKKTKERKPSDPWAYITDKEILDKYPTDLLSHDIDAEVNTPD